MSRLRHYWRERQEQVRRTLRGGYLHRLFGDPLFHRQIWRMDTRTLAGGLALGMFVTFTPTIPFQMTLCAVGALLLRVNLPVALAACWVTNPITALPVYLAAYRLGRFLVAGSAVERLFFTAFGMGGRTSQFLEQAVYLWSGCLIFSVVGAVSGYVAVRLAGWTLRRLFLRGE